MDFIPLEPSDDLRSFLESATSFPLKFVAINNPGDYENENIVFQATEKISGLDEYILVYWIENEETGLPDYARSRLLTFDCIELKKGATMQVFTRPGADVAAIGFDTGKLNQVMYWGLPAPIWHVAHSSYELIRRTDSIGGGPCTD